jgi:hypothetical protein
MHVKSAAAALCALALLALGAGATATAGTSTLHLGGSWAGTYGGAVSGKFTLTWTQTNGRLKGAIKLSRPSGAYPINGTVVGGKIRFGVVAVGATYKGSVSASGLKMSGTWASGPGGGTWSAHKLLTVTKIKLP